MLTTATSNQAGQRLLADARRPAQPQLRIHDLDRRRQRRRRPRVRDRRREQSRADGARRKRRRARLRRDLGDRRRVRHLQKLRQPLQQLRRDQRRQRRRRPAALADHLHAGLLAAHRHPQSEGLDRRGRDRDLARRHQTGQPRRDAADLRLHRLLRRHRRLERPPRRLGPHGRGRRRPERRTAGGEPEDHQHDQRAVRPAAVRNPAHLLRQLPVRASRPPRSATAAARPRPSPAPSRAPAARSPRPRPPAPAGRRPSRSTAPPPSNSSHPAANCPAPAFALVAGTNTVAFTNTYTPPKEEPPAASLKITNTISAPSGPPQSETQLTYSGSCPSALHDRRDRQRRLAPRRPSPAPSRARAARSPRPRPPAPAGRPPSRSTAPRPVEISPVSGGKLDGPHVRARSPAPTPSPSRTPTRRRPKKARSRKSPTRAPAAGSSTATRSSKARNLVLTSATSNQAGSAFWPTRIDPRNLSYEFTISIGGGSGADGLAFVIGDPTRGATATSLGEKGGGLGFAKVRGLGGRVRHLQKLGQPVEQLRRDQRRRRHRRPGRCTGWARSRPPPRCAPAPTKSRSRRPGGAIAVFLDGTKLGSVAVTLPSLRLRRLLGRHRRLHRPPRRLRPDARRRLSRAKERPRPSISSGAVRGTRRSQCQPVPGGGAPGCSSLLQPARSLSPLR